MKFCPYINAKPTNFSLLFSGLYIMNFVATDLCKILNVVADALADATVQISLADPLCQIILVSLFSFEFYYDING